MADQSKPAAALSYNRASGYVDEEYVKELSGTKGRKVIRQMCDNSTIGGLLLALHNLYRTVEWHVDPAQGIDDPDLADEYAGWAFRTLTEMGDPTYPLGSSWSDMMSISASALENGWSYIDISKKLQDDGTVGIGQVVHVHPETLDHWQEADDDSGRITGLWQYPPTGKASIFIPLERAVLYIPQPFKGSPEGRSILRPAYSDWFYRERLVTFRAILAERMAGFPVVKANSDILSLAKDPNLSDADRLKWSTLAKDIEKIAPNIKVNKQAGVTLWTKPYTNISADGDITYTNIMQLDVELLTPSGGNIINYDAAIQSHEFGIARATLAQFLLMGSGGSSSGQNGIENMMDFFNDAAQANLSTLADCFNRQLLPMVWRWNGLPAEYMPKLRAGKIDRTTLAALGQFVESLSRAGVVVNDPETEEHLRRESGLPIRDGLSENVR